MKKVVLPLIALFLAVPSQAGILDTLKKKPATQYELGKFKLELAAFMLTQEHKSKKIPNTNFKIRSFRIDESDGKLYFVVSSIGKAKDMNQATCRDYNEIISSNKAFGKVITGTWDGLSVSEKEQLSKEVIISTELVSKENAQFKISCS